MNKRTRQSTHHMERDIVTVAKKTFGKNLISLLVEGSYGTYDIVNEYSDYDLLAFVRDVDKTPDIDLDALSKKYSTEIQCSIKSYKDLLNRIKNSNTSSRFVDNIQLIKFKKQSRLLTGKNILGLIPPVSEIIKRDLGCDLRSYYYHATNPNPNWNIFIREPRKWANYIINMSNSLLLSKGVVVNKRRIPQMLKKHLPDFEGKRYVEEALDLRKSKKVLHLTKSEKEKFKRVLSLFLDAYQRVTFN